MYIVWKPFQLNFAPPFLSAASHRHSAQTAHGCPGAQLVARSCFERMCAQVPAHHGSARLSTSLRLDSRASKDLGISYGSFALQKSRHVESRSTLLSAHHICAHVLKSACAYTDSARIGSWYKLPACNQYGNSKGENNRE